VIRAVARIARRILNFEFSILNAASQNPTERPFQGRMYRNAPGGSVLFTFFFDSNGNSVAIGGGADALTSASAIQN